MASPSSRAVVEEVVKTLHDAEQQLHTSQTIPWRRGSEAAEKRGSTKRRKPILIISVDIGNGNQGEIKVYRKSDFTALATTFCEVHSLDVKLVPALAEHIKTNVQQVKKKKKKKAATATADGLGGSREEVSPAQPPSESSTLTPKERREQLEQQREQAYEEMMQKMGELEARATVDGTAVGTDAYVPSAPASRVSERMMSVPEPSRRDGPKSSRAGTAAPSNRGTRERNRVKNARDTSSRTAGSARRKVGESKRGTVGAPGAPIAQTKKIINKKKKKKKKKKGGQKSSRKTTGKNNSSGAKKNSRRRRKKREDVYSRLYAHAVERTMRIDDASAEAERLRREADALCTFKPKIHPAPGGWDHEDGDDGEDIHHRLYRSGKKAMQQRVKQDHMIMKAREEKELEACTFKPKISDRSRQLAERARAQMDRGASAAPDAVPDANASNRDPLQRFYNMPVFSRKVLALAKQQEAEEMRECTFKPVISERSRVLVRRRRKQKAGGDVAYPVAPIGGKTSEDMHARALERERKFEELYSDAQRRRERQDEYVAWKEAQHPFKPDIGLTKHRPLSDKTPSDFYERLHLSGKQKAERIAKIREQAASIDPRTGQKLFQPKTGRAPSFSRNKGGLPVHDFLFASRHEYEDKRRFLVSDAERHLDQMATKSYVLPTSQKLLHSRNRKICASAFLQLRGQSTTSSSGSNDFTDLSPDANIDTSKVSADSISDPGLRAVVGRILQALGGVTISFEEFSSLMEHELDDVARVPMPRGAGAGATGFGASATSRGEDDHFTFQPRINAKSREIAIGRRGDSGVPVHELLYLHRDKYNAQVEQERKRLIQEELAECTFKPNLVASSEQYRDIYERRPDDHYLVDTPAKTRHKARSRKATRPTEVPDVWSPDAHRDSEFRRGGPELAFGHRLADDHRDDFLQSVPVGADAGPMSGITPAREAAAIGENKPEEAEASTDPQEVQDVHPVVAIRGGTAATPATPVATDAEVESPSAAAAEADDEPVRENDDEDARLPSGHVSIEAEGAAVESALASTLGASTSLQSDGDAMVADVDSLLQDVRAAIARDDSVGYST